MQQYIYKPKNESMKHNSNNNNHKITIIAWKHDHSTVKIEITQLTAQDAPSEISEWKEISKCRQQTEQAEGHNKNEKWVGIKNRKVNIKIKI